MSKYEDDVTFTIQCTMRARWVPWFLGMLRKMQQLGSWGSSRTILFMSDGDGDFRPVFEWPPELPEPEKGGGPEHLEFDAG
jgi:hypothetical protein